MSNDILARLDPNCGVYQFLAPSGECYIGKSINFKRRKRQHLSLLRRGTHPNRLLQEAFTTFGTKLKLSLVALGSREALLGLEQWWIDNTNSAYNLTKSARCPFDDPQVLAKFKARISTPEHKNKQSAIGKYISTLPGVQASRSTRMSLRNNAPGARAKTSTAMTAYLSVPANKSKLTARSREFMNRPDVKLRYVSIRAEINSRPEVKAAIGKASRARFALARELEGTDASLVHLTMNELYELYLASLRKDACPADKPLGKAARNRYLRMKRSGLLNLESSSSARSETTKRF